MPASTHQGGDDEVESGLPAGGGHRADAVFEGGDALLEHRDRGIGYARVDMPGPLQVEEGGGVLDVLEDKGRRLIDRHGPRPRGGVGALPRMQGERVEAWPARGGHA